LGSSAHGRLWRFVVRARPFAWIAPCRRLWSRHRRPCRASTCADSSLRSRPVACTPLPHLSDDPARSKRGELVSEASPTVFWIRSDAAGLAVFALVAPLTDFLLAKPHPDGCLMIAPAAAGGHAARAPSPVRASRYCSLRCAPPCATVLIVGIPPGRPIYGSARVGVRVARPATCALVGALVSTSKS